MEVDASTGFTGDGGADGVDKAGDEGAFVDGFADWLGSRTRLPVRLAKANDLPLAGTVLVANASAHLSLGAGGRREPRHHQI